MMLPVAPGMTGSAAQGGAVAAHGSDAPAASALRGDTLNETGECQRQGVSSVCFELRSHYCAVVLTHAEC